MKSVLTLFLRGFVSVHVYIAVMLSALLGFDTSFVLSLLYGTVGGGASYYILKWLSGQKLLKQNQLTRKEYRYILRNLKEAQLKIKRLNKALLGIRSIHTAKQLVKLQRMVHRIYQIVKKEPKRFYQAERFFFYHLDSTVELSERYVFLKRQHVKDEETIQSLSTTEQTLEKLINSLEEDLKIVLSNDIDQLNLELDIANSALNREKIPF
jgi:5-bromo-4-chloroindolyl phosphate hydrolysis protein